jgi:hypothetical protein
MSIRNKSMRSLRSHRAAVGVTLGLLAGLTSGCADERAPIVRVQPQVLDKAFFVGANLADPKDDPEFFQRGYVVDGSASQSEIGVGTWAHVDRIRWEITENMLIARKAYQIVEGSDKRGLPAKLGNPADGVVVAAYKITKHFDVRRGYNPSTGEENNVLTENEDRPWYQRESFRVDWSSNEVNDPMWGESFMAKTFGNFKFAPLKYSPTDPNSPDQPYFGEAAQGYFDITNRFYIQPVEEDFFGFPFPKCALISFLTDSASYECDAQEATVRFSFAKVDDDEQDFERLENTRANLDVVGNPGGLGDSYSVGIVTAGRQTYDPKYAYLDGNYHAFANVHNIWKKSHADVNCDSKADTNNDGTADQCEGVAGLGFEAGSQCDVFAARPNEPTAKGRCTIPYRNREIRTVAYHVNKEMAPELIDPVDENGNPIPGQVGHSEDIVKSWNQMLANSVAYAREVECRRTGGSRETCHSQFFASEAGGVGGKEMVSFGGWLTDKPNDLTPVLTLCHNPVRAYDDQNACGPTGSSARMGDVRKNMMSYWPYESRAPYGGIANWEGDPLTGRIIGAAALTMGRSVTYGSAYARDVLQVAMGDRSINDLIEGVPAATYAQRLRSGQPGYTFPKDLLNKPVTDAKHAAQSIGFKPTPGTSAAQQYSSFLSGYGKSLEFNADAEAIAAFDARVKPLVGSKLEAEIVSPQWLSATLHVSPETNVTPDLVALASPIQKMSAVRMRASTEALRRRFTEMGACFTELDGSKAAIGSVTLPSLAAFYKQKYPDSAFPNAGGIDQANADEFSAALRKWRGEEMYKDLVGNTYKGIQLHEMGHSLGMLHQFASSWDAPNYDPQYWQLRTHEQGTDGSPSCEGNATADGTSCMGPRYLDPETDDERGRGDESRPGLGYFSHTSTMEYQYDRFGESVGLGSYDQFAMKALYGRVIETHDENTTGNDLANAKRFAHRMRSQQNEQDVIDWETPSGSFPQPVHYTELARQMHVFDPNRDCREATGEEKSKNEWRIVHNKVCQHTPKDHVAWADLQGDAVLEADPNTKAPYWHSKSDSPMGEKVRWFYRWGSEFNGHVHVNPFDSGADIYEVSVAARERFEASYPFQYFRRKQREFNQLTIANGVLGSYFERLRTYHWDAAVRGAQLYTMLGPKSDNAGTRKQEQAAFDKAFASDDWHRPYDKASAVLFESMSSAIVTPQVGTYSTSPDDSRTVAGWQTRTILDTKGTTVGTSKTSLDIGTGARYLDDDFDSGPFGGGSWQYTAWAKRVGYEQEKGLAFYSLTDGSAPVFAPNREFFLDWRTQNVSFQADMPGAVDRLLGGMLAEDWETIAPYLDGSTDKDGGNLIQSTNLIQEGAKRNEGAQLLFPNLGYRQQNVAAILAGIYSRDVDLTLVNKMRIYVDGIDGNLSKLTIPDEQQVRFYNPNTGFTYIARKFGPQEIDGKTVDRGIGSRMLQYANILQAAAYEVETEDGKVNGTPIFDQYGQPKLVLRDADGTLSPTGTPGYKPRPKGDGTAILPRPSNAQVPTVVRHDRYVGLMDATRQIGLIFGAGPL